MHNTQISKAALAVAVAQGMDPSTVATLPEYASDVSSLTDPYDELSVNSLHGEGEELPPTVVLDADAINRVFEPEITAQPNVSILHSVLSTADGSEEPPLPQLDQQFSGVRWPVS